MSTQPYVSRCSRRTPRSVRIAMVDSCQPAGMTALAHRLMRAETEELSQSLKLCGRFLGGPPSYMTRTVAIRPWV